MAKNYDDDDDENPFDERGILKDGARTRVRMMARDADSLTPLQRAIAQDASARLYSERKPGFVTADARRRHKVTSRDPQGRETGSAEWEEEDGATVLRPTYDAIEGRRRKQQAYDAMVRETCDAWRDPSPAPPTADAAPPVHRDAAPVGPTYDVAEGRRRKREAYDRMCREDADAWKDPSR